MKHSVLKQKYRCRMCGKEYTDATAAVAYATKDILELTTGLKQTDVFRADYHRVHFCEDGSLGIGDFLGYTALTKTTGEIE